ncbi:hypothetical protein XP95_23420 [Xanthomonas perforans]|nr:hypothetical protein XP95_23420 [Xanthomonas perforans]
MTLFLNFSTHRECTCLFGRLHARLALLNRTLHRICRAHLLTVVHGGGRISLDQENVLAGGCPGACLAKHYAVYTFQSLLFGKGIQAPGHTVTCRIGSTIQRMIDPMYAILDLSKHGIARRWSLRAELETIG